MKRAISKKGTYELEEFDKTSVLGTYPRNQLKKFIKREGFYEPVEEEEDKEEEEEVGNEVGNNKGIEGDTSIEAKIEPTSFEIRVPTLIVVEWSEYM